MIKNVRIKGYKSLDGLEVTLSPLTVIFGPNAAGKSNLLDALQLFSRLGTSKTLKEAFDFPYRGKPLESFTFPANGIAGLVDQGSVSFSLEVDVEITKAMADIIDTELSGMRSGLAENGVKTKKNVVQERFLRYALEIEFLPAKGFLRVKDEMLCALKSDLSGPKKSREPFLKKEGSRFSLRMEGQAHPTYHDVGLDYTVLSKPLYPPHYPHMTAMKRELESWRFFYFEPRERMRAANPVKEVGHIGMMGEDLAAYLNTIKVKSPQRFEAVERALHTLIPATDAIQTEIDKFGEVELRVVENGVPISARLLSEGTLRLLGLLAIGSSEEPSVICFEEPENGIHPRRITMVAEYLKNMSRGHAQLIVTTHSPLLPDLMDDASLYVCRKRDGKTSIVPFIGGIFRDPEIKTALDEERTLPSEMILRGDLDA